MAISPFAQFSNAILFFTLPSESSSLDPITGNRVFEPGAVVEVTAKLRANSSARIERLPGIDPGAIYLEGRVTKVSSLGMADSILLPDSIKPSDIAAATWSQKTGQFVFVFSDRSAYGIENILGDKLKGWFTFK